MSETRFFRLIEAYFDGSILPNEKLLLEKQIQKDPLLKAEFELQQNIVSGIKQTRHIQLKQRLSGIEVPPVSISLIQTAAVKWLAGSIAVTTVLGSLFYWFSATNDLIIPIDLKVSQSIDLTDDQSITLSSPQVLYQKNTSEPEFIKSKLNSNSVAKKVETENRTVDQSARNINRAETNSENNNIAIKPQALLSFEDEKLFAENRENDIDHIKPIAIKIAPASDTQIKVLMPKEAQKYHYQYYNNKLFLYGNFSEEPYEIIELKQKGDRKLYLSYKDTVFIIMPDVSEITELQQLHDAKLLQELLMVSDNK